MVIHKGLLRHLAEDQLEGQIDGGRPVPGVVHHHLAVAGDLAQNADGTVLAIGQALEQPLVGLFDEQAVVLLVLGAPDLQHGQGVIADVHLADVVRGSGGLHDLLQDVAVSAGTLIVDADDGIIVAEVAARPHEAVDAVPHLGIAALDGVKVQGGVLGRLAGRLAGGGTAAETDAVGRSADLDDQHAFGGFALGGVPSIELPNAGREHDGLDPLEALAVGEALTEAAGEAMDDRFAELVAVVAGTIRSLHLNLEGSGEIVGIHKRFVLPRQFVSGDVEVADAVRTHTSDGIGSASGGGDVAQPAAGTGLGPGERRDAAGEVVRLGREEGMERLPSDGHGTGFSKGSGEEGIALITLNHRRIVMKRNDGIVGHILGQSFLDHLEQRLGLLLAIDDHFPAEEPVAAVFRVGLAHVEALHVGGVAAELFLLLRCWVVGCGLWVG